VEKVGATVFSFLLLRTEEFRSTDEAVLVVDAEGCSFICTAMSPHVTSFIHI
jgi:hypothetical protein